MSGENHPMFGKTHSAETKAKISEVNKGKRLSAETKAKISEAHLGKLVSEEAKKRISQGMIGNKNATYGVGRKRTDGAGSPPIKIEVWDYKMDLKTIYPSISEAAKALNVPSGSIRMYFYRKTLTPYKGRYLLKKL